MLESETKYKIRDVGGEAGDYHIEIAGNNYRLIRKSPGTYSYDVGSKAIDITYTDENNFSVNDHNTTDECDANRPEEILSYVERKSGVWRRKMGYGNANINNNCDPALEPAGQNFTYFQFIGDDRNMTASGYSDVPIGFTDWSNIEDYRFEDETDATANPICIVADQSPSAAEACTSDNPDISTPNYGIEDEWMIPADLAKIWAAFPDGFD